MRSKLRTLFALLLSVTMVFGLCASAFAEIGTSGKIVESGTWVPEETAEAPAEEAAEAPAEEAAEAPAEEAAEAPAEEAAEAPAEEAAEEPAEEAADTGLHSTGYLMFANADWSVQYWGGDAPEGVTVTNADVTGAGSYTVGLAFDTPSEGLAFTAVGLENGEVAFPGYAIEVTGIRVNGEAIEFGKGYTSSDDGVVTRMNLYNEWVSDLPEDAHSYDGSLEGATPTPVSKDAFTGVTSFEVDFVLHQYGVDTGYIMFANGDWSVQYWGGEAPEGVTVTNAVVEGPGDYTVGLAFDTPSEGVAFTALGIVNGEKTLNGASLKINEIRVNGEPVEFAKGYTSSDDGVTTRMNIFNEWVSALPEDARSYDGTTEGASWIILDTAAFTGVTSYEIDFTVVPVTDTAYIMYANSDWSVQYWGGEAPEGVTAENATVNGQGTYTVSLTFDQPAAGLAFAAVGIVTGEQTFPGYFIDIASIKVNGEFIPVSAGYTTSDDGITTRENIYNEWVSELPAEARRADGSLEGASAIIVDTAAFAEVSSVEVTFDYIYGKPAEKAADAPLTEDEAAELLKVDYNAYIGVQTTSYIFRNSWDEGNYGRDSEANPDFFWRLTGWDGDGNAVDYGGTFEDAVLTTAGSYSVSLTTGDMGFGSDEAFRLLFVSTDIPSKLVKDGFLEITDVQIKIGESATQKYTDVDTSGEYVRIVVFDEYNRSEDPFGYTVPGANATITITFTVSGLTD